MILWVGSRDYTTRPSRDCGTDVVGDKYRRWRHVPTEPQQVITWEEKDVGNESGAREEAGAIIYPGDNIYEYEQGMFWFFVQKWSSQRSGPLSNKNHNFENLRFWPCSWSLRFLSYPGPPGVTPKYWWPNIDVIALSRMSFHVNVRKPAFLAQKKIAAIFFWAKNAGFQT